MLLKAKLDEMQLPRRRYKNTHAVFLRYILRFCTRVLWPPFDPLTCSVLVRQKNRDFKGTESSYPPPIPGIPGCSIYNIYTFHRNIYFRRCMHFDTAVRLHLRLVHAIAENGRLPKVYHSQHAAACDSFIIGLLSGFQRRLTPRL